MSVGRKPSDAYLASQPTMTRLENSVGMKTLYKIGIAQTTTSEASVATLTRQADGITITTTGRMQYRVFDAAGRITTSGTANGTTTLANATLPTGISIIQVATAQGVNTWKVK